MTHVSIQEPAEERSHDLLRHYERRFVELPPRFLVQMAHLTTPATVWKYVETACTRSKANLVMLDLEDSIPRGNDTVLRQGRENVIRAYRELDWGPRLRFFRPRGIELDPGHADIQAVVEGAGDRVQGLVYPKIESADEVRSIDATLTALEHALGLPEGHVRIEVLIESVAAEEQVFEIARSSKRLVGLIFGSYDYWGSLGMRPDLYRTDHPLIDHARARIVKAAAHVGMPAIAEMTLNYPTKDKSEQEQRTALEECMRDAIHARTFGFAGKWTGIPQQIDIALEVFGVPDALVDRAVEEARAFLEAERAGRGATMIKGKMADRATDRMNRVVLEQAFALGRIDRDLARELGLGR